MARGRPFQGARVLHPRFGRRRAPGIQAAIVIRLVLLGTFHRSWAYFIFITVLSSGLTVGALSCSPAGGSVAPSDAGLSGTPTISSSARTGFRDRHSAAEAMPHLLLSGQLGVIELVLRRLSGS